MDEIKSTIPCEKYTATVLADTLHQAIATLYAKASKCNYALCAICGKEYDVISLRPSWLEWPFVIAEDGSVEIGLCCMNCRDKQR